LTKWRTTAANFAFLDKNCPTRRFSNHSPTTKLHRGNGLESGGKGNCQGYHHTKNTVSAKNKAPRYRTIETPNKNESE